MSAIKSRKMLSALCALLMLVLLILQFMPFWQYGEETNLASSMQSYIWFPNDHKELTSYIESHIDDYNINQILLLPIITLVAGACGIVLCLIRGDHPAVHLFPAVCGVVGIWGYLSSPVYQLGSNWMLHLVVCIALTAVAAYALYQDYKALKNAQ